MTDNGTITNTGSLFVGQFNPAGTGAVQLAAGSELTTYAYAGPSPPIAFIGGSRLDVFFGNSNTLGGLLKDFGAGDVLWLSLAGSPTSETLKYDAAHGLLQVITPGGGVGANLTFDTSSLGPGSFHMAPGGRSFEVLITRS
jgi:hypothetical protein